VSGGKKGRLLPCDEWGKLRDKYTMISEITRVVIVEKQWKVAK